jgi:asparagine synthase (glutamine-hydrolysing)
MCGIIVLWGTAITKEQIESALAALAARGPDIARAEIMMHDATGHTIGFGFARLHIQGTRAGAEQPFRMTDGTFVAVNGEVFNSEILVETLRLAVPEGSSDCAVVPALLERGMPLETVARQLDGDFAIVSVNPATGVVETTRDPYGVRPMFYAEGAGWAGLASEIKGFPAGATHVEAIEPGTVRRFRVGAVATEVAEAVTTWHQPPWLKVPFWRASVEGLTAGGQALAEAVAKRLSTVRAVGACLSGGLDSSLVAAIAARILARRGGRRLHTYSIGMAGSPDLEHARLVAAHIGSIHHERIVEPEECLAAIPAVVKAIESFDITTVRASVGNYLVGRLVTEKTPEVKVVLNGDGADEVLGGYLYMRAAPDDAAFEAETDRLLREIHRYDVLRSERSMAAHGLESRSPFLDRQFVSVARGLPTDALRPTPRMMEKSILRTAFAGKGLLPDAVLWRRKEAFSDGISRAERSWFEMARAEGERRSGAGWKRVAEAFMVNPPPTAEALWYRQLFHESYPEAAAAAAAPAMWMPRFIAGATDPSARTLTALYQNGGSTA